MGVVVHCGTKYGHRKENSKAKEKGCGSQPLFLYSFFVQEVKIPEKALRMLLIASSELSFA